MQETTPAWYHDAWQAIVGAGGILVLGRFVQHGSEGMMLTIKYARESKIPFLGICLGFQLAMVDWARNMLDLPGAMSRRQNTPLSSLCPRYHARISDVTARLLGSKP